MQFFFWRLPLAPKHIRYIFLDLNVEVVVSVLVHCFKSLFLWWCSSGSRNRLHKHLYIYRQYKGVILMCLLPDGHHQEHRQTLMSKIEKRVKRHFFGMPCMYDLTACMLLYFNFKNCSEQSIKIHDHYWFFMIQTQF